jgi:hypothetical protein
MTRIGVGRRQERLVGGRLMGLAIDGEDIGSMVGR